MRLPQDQAESFDGDPRALCGSVVGAREADGLVRRIPGVRLACSDGAASGGLCRRP